MSRLLLKALALALLAGLGLAGTAAAASVETPPTWLGVPRWVFAWINLIVLWGFLWRAAGPMIKTFLANRKTEISEGLALAKNQRAESEEMSAALDQQLADLKQDLDDMVERNKVEGEKERQEILAMAEQDKERLLDQARFEIRSRTSQAKAGLARDTAQLAAAAASQQVVSEIGPADLDRFFDSSLDRLREKLS